MIIDFRMKPPLPAWEQLFAEGRDALTGFLNLQGLEPIKSETLGQVIGEMDAFGITHAVVMGRGNEPGSSNKELGAFLGSQPTKRFIGFIGLDNMDVEGAVETIETYAASQLFHGVSINPVTLQPLTPIGDPSWDPILEACLRHNLPLSITLSGFLGLISPSPDYDYIRPNRLIRAARKYPELNIVISHGAWPFVSEAVTTAIYCPNIYLSPDLYLGFPGSQLYVEAANFPLSDRILYGSCYPNMPYGFALQHFRSQSWNEGVLDKVLYENGARLLGLGLPD
ncbi:amidohydrolase family protein [Paenibacillus sepulcri]|uniref:Amidohydrolase family protein n=1 Tax=Paenibacillus sepulcri TaxID=359917 RepID=A0ABS7BX97_9BACL|nr:amidohydrolase family protein [Paenibacillus sepulcri]